MTAPTPNLIIHGCHAGDIWVETNGDLTCYTRRDLAHLSRWVVENGTTTLAGNTFDESDVSALVDALNGPQLDDCANGCESPGLVPIEGRTVCPGCAAGFGIAEDESGAA